MKMKVLTILLLYSWGLLATPNEKLINYLTQIHESLMHVVNAPIGSRKQVVHLDRAKQLAQEAILAEGIAEHAVLYAIAGILLGDPVLAARAVQLEKEKARKRNSTIQLERREITLEDEAEKYRFHLEDRIEEEEMYLLTADKLTQEEVDRHTILLDNLKKTKSWAEAQVLAHGFLKEAIYMYKNHKEQEGE